MICCGSRQGSHRTGDLSDRPQTAATRSDARRARVVGSAPL